jgi:hypothetical protein
MARSLSAEALFETYLGPLYPPDVLADLARARATDANPANNAGVLDHLDDAAQVFVSMHARALGRDLTLDFSDASVHRLGAALTRDVRDALAGSGAAGSAESDLFNVIVHGAAYVGACVVRGHGGVWLVRRPLWESRVRLQSRAGDAELGVLSWWLRALCDEGLDDAHAGLAERYRAYVEVPTLAPETLTPIASPRALPRLTKVRYDTFVKYLKAHLPELRDVGRDFPSPERFEDYRFAWLDFTLVGGGRMLVVSGFGEGGLHAFWLDASGFAKSALFAADAVPEPVCVDGDKLAFVVSLGGETHVHEVLWWGP